MSGGPIFGEQTSIRETQRLSLESLPLPKLRRPLAPTQQQASRNQHGCLCPIQVLEFSFEVR